MLPCSFKSPLGENEYDLCHDTEASQAVIDCSIPLNDRLSYKLTHHIGLNHSNDRTEILFCISYRILFQNKKKNNLKN